MCEKTKKKIDRASILYKIFIIIMIVGQVMPLILGEVILLQMFLHIPLIIYLIFRYYMLVKLKNRAIKHDLSLTEFLQERDICIDSKKCD